MNYSSPNDKFIQKVDLPIIIFEVAKDKLVLNKCTDELILYFKSNG